MKPTKMRNLQIYKATLEFRSRQLASPLSKDLRKKYNKRSVRVIEGDTVLVVRGEYKEIVGKVIKSNAAEGTIAIEDIKKEKGKGEKIDVMIHASNVVITSLDTSDKWRRARLNSQLEPVLGYIFTPDCVFRYNMFLLSRTMVPEIPRICELHDLCMPTCSPVNSCACRFSGVIIDLLPLLAL